jgi:hypothetical protein
MKNDKITWIFYDCLTPTNIVRVARFIYYFKNTHPPGDPTNPRAPWDLADART